tara:strand:- start:5344 stop:5487 length:144 start_codon:yes stop_codon:yes gene_type:complete
MEKTSNKEELLIKLIDLAEKIEEDIQFIKKEILLLKKNLIKKIEPNL